ncbi:hypothetical protein BGZ49_009362 [Haplosporangium sp. Z 27]|nr:hypothetical protein BGZ49_009362 [Haplosporangium sp. Z 27]
MTTNDPLFLPEIQLLVGQYLENRDLLKCIRVCRFWHTAFLPFLWEDVTLKYRFINGQPIGPPLDSLQRNRHFVQILRMQAAFSTNYAITYPRLHTLTLQMVDAYNNRQTSTTELEHEHNQAPLIRFNPTIVNLTIEYSHGIYTENLWREIVDLENLKNLQVWDSTIDSDSASNFWELFTQLNKLVLIRSSVVRSNTIPPQQIYPQLRRLELDQVDELDGVAQLDLIHRCPGLRYLTWRPRPNLMMSVSGQFIRDLTSGNWPNLKSLSLTKPISDLDLSSILSGMNQDITELQLDRTGFSDRAFEVLKQRYFDTIVSLNITDCIVTSEMNQQILSSCPRLEQFESTSILTSTIIDGDPWICLSLKKLYINISNTQWHIQTSHEEVFKRLSRLTQLEDLHIGNREYRRLRSVPHRGLRLKLDCGVGVLASLKRIKYLSWSYTRQNLVLEDVEWMLENWKGLEKVIGILHSDDTIGNPLREKLKAHGVAVFSIAPA